MTTKFPETQAVVDALQRMVDLQPNYPGLDKDRVLVEGYARSLWDVRHSKTGRQVRDRLLAVSRSVFEYWEGQVPGGRRPVDHHPSYRPAARRALRAMIAKKAEEQWT